MSVREERRQNLRIKLIDLAEAKIRSDGLHSVTARYLSKEAGCALGAIYNMFDDMNELFVEVNLRSFQRLADTVKSAVKTLNDPSPHEQLDALAQAYLRFALDNPRLWKALFEIEMTTQSNVPQTYKDSLAQLLLIIAEPMALVFPNKSKEEIGLVTQTVFSSIHGIVHLGAEQRLSAVPEDQMPEMIRFMINQLGDAT